MQEGYPCSRWGGLGEHPQENFDKGMQKVQSEAQIKHAQNFDDCVIGWRQDQIFNLDFTRQALT